MKKFLSATMASLMLLGSAAAVSADDTIKVILDGSELTFDVPPQVIEGRTLVPLRVIFEALGAEVNWDGETRTVTATKGETTVKMTADSKQMYVNSEEIVLDIPAQIIDNRTLVPARAVAEGFGAEVGWDNETRVVSITSKTEKYTFKYDDSIEIQESYMRNFKVTSATKNADGDFDIEYTLDTFYEGRGTVTVSFNLLDASGNVIGTLTENFVGTDYTWSVQEAKATIPGATAEFQLVIK